jgi:hypothetical protein
MFMARLTGDVCSLRQRPLGEYVGEAQQASGTEAVGREKTLDCGVEICVVGGRYWSKLAPAGDAGKTLGRMQPGRLVRPAGSLII